MWFVYDLSHIERIDIELHSFIRLALASGVNTDSAGFSVFE